MKKTLEDFVKKGAVVTLNPDGSRTIVCPDGTKVTLKASSNAESQKPLATAAVGAHLA